MSFVQLGRLMAVLALIGALLAMILVQRERGKKAWYRIRCPPLPLPIPFVRSLFIVSS
jgi:hypothetical protein